MLSLEPSSPCQLTKPERLPTSSLSVSLYFVWLHLSSPRQLTKPERLPPFISISVSFHTAWLQPSSLCLLKNSKSLPPFLFIPLSLSLLCMAPTPLISLSANKATKATSLPLYQSPFTLYSNSHLRYICQPTKPEWLPSFLLISLSLLWQMLRV
jgi:hypothetical protein